MNNEIIQSSFSWMLDTGVSTQDVEWLTNFDPNNQSDVNRAEKIWISAIQGMLENPSAFDIIINALGGTNHPLILNTIKERLSKNGRKKINSKSVDEISERNPPKNNKKTKSKNDRSSFDLAEKNTELQIQMTFWPEDVRGIPNAALRGALFSISKIREMLKNRTNIATVDGYNIVFRGERFNQHDLDVIGQLLHISRNQPYGKPIQFNAKDLLLSLDRGTGGADYDELKEDMARLMGGVIEITYQKTNTTFAGTLLRNFYRDENTQRYHVEFDEKIKKLYDDGYTHVDWIQRKKLNGNSLAKFLHSFYSTHAAPLEYKVSTYKELCGSTTGRLSDFRTALKVALKRLEEVDAISFWDIDPETDLVKIKRKSIALSQKRHLKKNSKSENSDF